MVWSSVVPQHSGDIPIGTLRSIERAMEPVFGEGVAAMTRTYRVIVTREGGVNWPVRLRNLRRRSSIGSTCPCGMQRS